MGSSLDDFNVRLEFDADGRPEKIMYWDQAGCGHEAPFGPNVPIGDVAAYHLSHYDRAHGMQPPKLCGFTISFGEPGGAYAGELSCMHEPHEDHTPHRFELSV